jgi:hypothetical protein
MSETQGYKNGQEFTVPGEAAGMVRKLFAVRLETVQQALSDPLINKVFTKSDLQGLAFEELMLAQMLRRMPEAEAAHA